MQPPEEKRLFDKLRDAYIQARYDPEFIVSCEELDAFLKKVSQLQQITEKACLERVAYYQTMGNNV